MQEAYQGEWGVWRLKMQLYKKEPQMRQRGFSLVELLVVIAIIGILIGLLLPAINAVRKRGRITAISFEVQNLKNAIEQYKQTYGDYPPDGSNWTVVSQHVRVIFPRINRDEFELFRRLTQINGTNQTYMDPSEALVFFLGGFSDDPRYPFTGEGGPFSANRTNSFFEFDPERLTLDTANVYRVNYNYGGNVMSALIPSASTDEKDQDIHGNLGPDYVNYGDHGAEILVQDANGQWGELPDDYAKIDVFPAYLPENCTVPYTYFDSRTYIPRTIYGGSRPAEFPMWDSAIKAKGQLLKPYRSDNVRPVVAGADDQYPAKFVNDDSFQIISAGIDNNYGAPNGLWKHFPSGEGYTSGDNSNIASFGPGALEDQIP